MLDKPHGHLRQLDMFRERKALARMEMVRPLTFIASCPYRVSAMPPSSDSNDGGNAWIVSLRFLGGHPSQQAISCNC